MLTLKIWDANQISHKLSQFTYTTWRMSSLAKVCSEWWNCAKCYWDFMTQGGYYVTYWKLCHTWYNCDSPAAPKCCLSATFCCSRQFMQFFIFKVFSLTFLALILLGKELCLFLAELGISTVLIWEEVAIFYHAWFDVSYVIIQHFEVLSQVAWELSSVQSTGIQHWM